jgi:solute carrier family 45 protein 1/2/4
MGIEVNRLSASALPSYRRLEDFRLSVPRSDSMELLSPITPASALSAHSSRPLRSPSTPQLRVEHDSIDESIVSTGELSGLYFGILNIYTTLPQFLGTFISMIVFSILEPGKSPELASDADPSEHHGTDGPNAIAVCLFIGALSAVGAAWATKKLRDLQ